MYSLWADPIENTVSNSLCNVASRVGFSAKEFIGHLLAMTASSVSTIPVFQLPSHNIYICKYNCGLLLLFQNILYLAHFRRIYLLLHNEFVPYSEDEASIYYPSRGLFLDQPSY
jgi:hypothetical protein